MTTTNVAVEDLNESQEFVDVNGDVCIITSVDFDDSVPTICCEYCGEEEYYWVYFTRPDGSGGQYRLWKLEELNVLQSN